MRRAAHLPLLTRSRTNQRMPLLEHLPASRAARGERVRRIGGGRLLELANERGMAADAVQQQLEDEEQGYNDLEPKDFFDGNDSGRKKNES